MMQTPAISPVTKSSAGPSHAKAATDDSSGLPFNEMLSREIADRGAPARDTTPVKSADNAAKNTQATQASSPANDAAAAKDDNAPASATDPVSNAPATQTAEAGKGKPAADDDKKDDTEDGLSAASNELIALVANMNQPRATAADSAADAAANAAKDDKKDDTLIAALDDKGAGAQTQDDTAALAAATTATAAQATAQPTDVQADPATVATADTDFGKAIADANAAAAIPAAPTASPAAGNSKPQPLVAPTPMERSLAMSTKPGESELKASLGAKGKHSATGASVADAKAEVKSEQVSEHKGATETIDAATPTARSETTATPAEATAIRTAKDALPQHESTTIPTPAPGAITAPAATALNQVQAAAAQLAQNLTPRVGTQEWNQALGQKVVWMANGEQQSASLTLNPPDLGPLQVVLSVTNNHATANFTAAQPEVRQALESAMPKLREMLGDAGIQLGQANVSAGTPNQQNAFQSPSQQSSRHGASGNSSGNTIDTPVRVSRVQPAKSGAGLVDTFA